MRRLLAIALVLSACAESKKPETSGKVDCTADMGWVDFVRSSTAAPDALKAHGGAWISFYKRDYPAALTKFERSQEPHAAFAARRTHLRLAELQLELARFTADTFAAYAERRSKLGAEAGPLPHLSFWQSVATRTEEPTPSMKVGACDAPASPTRYGDLYRAFRCETAPSCTAKENAFAASHPLHGHEQDLYALACTADSSDGLRERASKPAIEDTIEKKLDGETVTAKLPYHDPVANYALAQFHLRKMAAEQDVLIARAQRLNGKKATSTKGPKDPRAWLFSRYRGLTDTVGSAPLSGDALRAAYRAADDALACGSPANLKTAENLRIARSFVHAQARRAAGSPQDPKTCGDALERLRETSDLKAPDRVGYVNEPAFLVRLASAAVCRGRSAEAVGALRGVRAQYPEAQGAVAALEALSVARMMGGSDATQRTQ